MFRRSNIMLPKRRFWTVEEYVGRTFCKHISSLLAKIEYLRVWKVLTKRSYQQLLPTYFSTVQNVSIFLINVYAPQTKILEGVTKRCVCVFEVLFKGVSTRFGRPLIENSFKNAYATLCSTLENLCSPNEDFGPSKNMWVRPFVSTFHTPKYSIWAKSDEKCLQNALPTYFETVRNLRLGSIKFFVWGP